MSALQFSQVAKDHFESIAPQNIAHGYEKYIVTDGEKCLIVRSDYKARAGEIVFHCSIKNGIPCVELFRTGKTSPTPVSAN